MMRRRLMGAGASDEYIRFADPEVERICVANWGDGVGLTYGKAAAVTSLGTVFKNNAIIKTFDELKYFTALTTLNFEAFRNCAKLNIPDLSNVKILDSMALRSTFLGPGIVTVPCEEVREWNICGSLCRVKGVYLPNLKKLTCADNTGSAFYYLDQASCKFIDIGEKVTFIAKPQLEASPAILYFVVRATVPPAFLDRANFVWGKANIYVPDESVDAYKSADGWSNYANIIKPLSEYVEP